MKLFSQPVLAALVLVVAASGWTPSNAQQTADHAQDGLQHLGADSMNAADEATLASDHRELVEAAEIYGYNLAAGNWTYRQTLCAVMPDTILLHFWRQYPDGTESLFTALLPRGAGSVRIVPVLYRDATPFVPAPKNPRNYAVFNELVSTTDQGTISNRKWVELSACYAEMTGAMIDSPLNSKAEIGIAGAPSPTIHAKDQDKAARVTLSTREGENSYKLWSVSFDRRARVIAVVTEDRTVNAAEANPPVQTALATEKPHSQTQESMRTAGGGTPQSSTTSRVTATAQRATENAEAPQPRPSTAVPAFAAATTKPGPEPAITAPGREPSAEQSSDEPGWKSVLHPADPPAKIEPQAPPPPEKFIPSPPDAADQDTTPQQ